MKTLTFGSGIWDPRTRALLADGAWGTQFMNLGLSQGEPPEAWNLQNPDAVLSVARSYARAGSDIILTNSFGASSLKLARHGLAEQAYTINKRAAELSVLAAAEASTQEHQVIVGGDLGPCGKLVVMGEIEEAALYDVFSEQAQALKDGGAHWLVIETMIDRAELAVAVRAAAATGLVVAATMTYECTSVGYRTVMGDTPQDCIRTALEAGASVVGANCGAGIDSYVELARQLRGMTDTPLWIKANAGLPEMIADRTVYRMTADAFCSYIPALLDAGVNIVGGCCGTSPDFIACARALVS
jgi:5-methyltetrahydrofolate--homocysteine methyltransferase